MSMRRDNELSFLTIVTYPHCIQFPHHGRLSYGRSPRLLWQLRYAARHGGSTINRRQGMRAGHQKLPTPERRQNESDRGKNPGIYAQRPRSITPALGRKSTVEFE